LNASRTAAKASKTSSLTGSPFSIRCLNSAVLPASSASESCSNSGVERADVGRLAGEPLEAPALA